MELDNRKISILKMIIRTYLDTGEPVGSRTISKGSDLNLSSATIRNEMADLEEHGYIFQPHTSSGRIPTDKGYRFYVDNLMQDKMDEIERMKDIILDKTEKLDAVLKQTAKLLADSTNYLSLVSSPQKDMSRIRFLQLSQVMPEEYLLVTMMEGNVIKNSIIEIDRVLNNEDMTKINLLLNSQLQGLSSKDINLEVIRKLKQQSGKYLPVMEEILDALSESVREDEELEVYTSGATNLFKYPELTEQNAVGGLISAIEEKEKLTKMINERMDLEEVGKKEIKVYIGNENSAESMRDCSLVTASYQLPDGLSGTIGIIGPKRMDYEKVVSDLQVVMEQLDDIFKDDKKKKKNRKQGGTNGRRKEKENESGN